jgi:hypothetical protein
VRVAWNCCRGQLPSAWTKLDGEDERDDAAGNAGDADRRTQKRHDSLTAGIVGGYRDGRVAIRPRKSGPGDRRRGTKRPCAALVHQVPALRPPTERAAA